jgi:hypothetical protein
MMMMMVLQSQAAAVDRLLSELSTSVGEAKQQLLGQVIHTIAKRDRMLLPRFIDAVLAFVVR